MLTEKQKKDLNYILDFIKVGDALGMGFEYTSPEYVREHYYGPDQFYEHPVWDKNIKAGMYTDDTQMSMALISLMREKDQQEWFDDRVVAAFFLREYKKDPRFGYSKGLQRVLESSRDWVDFLDKIYSQGERSLKNGGCMRVVPLGVLDDLNLVKRFARFQAEITHKDSAVVAAEMVAVASWYLYHTDERKVSGDSLITFAKANSTTFPDLFRRYEYIRVDSHEHVGMLTAQTAISMAGEMIDSRHWQAGLNKIMRIGGDTDTVAAIAFGLWGCFMCNNTSFQRRFYHRRIEPLLENIR